MLHEIVRQLYSNFGQRKAMGISAQDTKHPHYFLHRTFLGENDLLIILNTKRCAYQCFFCQLPAKSSKLFVNEQEILAQLEFVFYELKHSLSVMDRITLSNEGSVLDQITLPVNVLYEIARCANEMKRVRKLVLETRLEYVDVELINEIKIIAPRVSIDILTGFETHDPIIRDEMLGKNESLNEFERGLDKVAQSQSSLTAYILYKPSPFMTDEEGFLEASTSIDYLCDQCDNRNIPLTIRLNPMYAASKSRWAKIAHRIPTYKPPRLSDVLKLAEVKRKEGACIYIGLSTENLDDGSTYMSREDYSMELLKRAIAFNSEIKHISPEEIL